MDGWRVQQSHDFVVEEAKKETEAYKQYKVRIRPEKKFRFVRRRGPTKFLLPTAK